MALAISALSSFAQTPQKPKRILPAYQTAEELRLRINSKSLPQTQTLGKTALVPPNLRYPGEFEESQAVLISWPYDFDNNGNVFIDTSNTYGNLWAQLAHAIQQSTLCIIRVDTAADTIPIKQFMQNRGTPLVNYSFFIQLGDAWWMRDFGPHGIYYGDADSIGFIDLKYYEGRDNDDVFAPLFATSIGKPIFTSRLNGEGGNLMTDGFGTVFFSSVFDSANTDVEIVNPPFTTASMLDTISALFGSKQNVMLQHLLCDGGTGHIDLYLKMVDEQTIIAAQYPQVITASDRQTIEDNMQYIASFNSTYNRPFRVFRVPHPTSNNGTYNRVNCTQMNDDARTFINGLTVNKTFIFPSYSNATSGNTTQTAEVKNLYSKIFPGYNIVDIDSRLLSILGGELHCVTMQVPAENPVLFWHPSVDGLYSSVQSNFNIIAKITNKSGIQKASCFWRKKGTTQYNEVVLTDSSGYFIGKINAGSLTQSDEIEYYLSATTNNGKTAFKPIGAPEGNYQIYFTPRTGFDEYKVETKNYLFAAYPVPASDKLTIPFFAEQVGEAQMVITDLTGKEVKRIKHSQVAYGMNEAHVNTADIESGIYFYSYFLNGSIIATRKFIVQH